MTDTTTTQDDDAFFLFRPSWLRFFILLNAFLGLLVFEFAWKKLERRRNPNKELDALFPQFLRPDCHKFVKWHFYPGAMTMMLPRILYQFVIGITLTTTVKLILGGDPTAKPNERQVKLLKLTYKIHTHALSLVSYFTLLRYNYLTLEDVNHYEEYLGPKSEQKTSEPSKSSRVRPRGPGRCSVVVSNHRGFLDVFNFICSPIFPGFAPKKEIINVPFAGVCSRGLQSLFIPRGGTDEEREQLLKTITDRQKLVEDDSDSLPPICMFPEGSTSCGEGTHILPFRQGAFVGMRTVQPCYITLNHGEVKPVFCSIDLRWLIVMMCASFQFNTSTVTIMPEFTPTEKMLELHADKGKEDWEVFAWCVQDAIAKKGDMKKAKYESLKTKNIYEGLYNQKTDEVEFNGVKYYPTGAKGKTE